MEEQNVKYPIVCMIDPKAPMRCLYIDGMIVAANKFEYYSICRYSIKYSTTLKRILHNTEHYGNGKSRRGKKTYGRILEKKKT